MADPNHTQIEQIRQAAIAEIQAANAATATAIEVIKKVQAGNLCLTDVVGLEALGSDAFITNNHGKATFSGRGSYTGIDVAFDDILIQALDIAGKSVSASTKVLQGLIKRLQKLIGADMQLSVTGARVDKRGTDALDLEVQWANAFPYKLDAWIESSAGDVSSSLHCVRGFLRVLSDITEDLYKVTVGLEKSIKLVDVGELTEVTKVAGDLTERVNLALVSYWYHPAFTGFFPSLTKPIRAKAPPLLNDYRRVHRMPSTIHAEQVLAEIGKLSRTKATDRDCKGCIQQVRNLPNNEEIIELEAKFQDAWQDTSTATSEEILLVGDTLVEARKRTTDEITEAVDAVNAIIVAADKMFYVAIDVLTGTGAAHQAFRQVQERVLRMNNTITTYID